MSDFKGVAQVFMRPGQWVAVNGTGKEVNVKVCIVMDQDGNLEVTGSDKYGKSVDSVWFGEDGKVFAQTGESDE